MAKKILILGAGVVGTAAAEHLSKNPSLDVTLTDLSGKQLDKAARLCTAKTLNLDLNDSKKLVEELQKHELVLGAMPESIAFKVLLQALELGLEVVDVSFFEEDTARLAKLADLKKTRLALDCGVAPGLSHMMVGQACGEIEQVQDVVIYVGGLPIKREYPWEYKAVFSPTGVIAEYIRPARIIENYQQITVEALSDLEILEFPGIGELEAFTTDGLRTLLSFNKAKFMREKTLRYPGHAEKIELLKSSGFLNAEEIEINGMQISPLEFTTSVLFPQWSLEAEEEDVTIMRVLVCGTSNGKEVEIKYDLAQHYDPQTKLTAMARTTGYTAAAVVELFLSDTKLPLGLITPEQIGADKKFMKFIENVLESRNITWSKNTDVISR